jgi:hypothetical protein
MKGRDRLKKVMAVMASVLRILCVGLFLLTLASWGESYFASYRAGRSWPLPTRGMFLRTGTSAGRSTGWELDAGNGQAWVGWVDVEPSIANASTPDYASHVKKEYRWLEGWPKPFSEIYTDYQEAGKHYWSERMTLLTFIEFGEDARPGFADWYIAVSHAFLALVFGIPSLFICIRWAKKFLRKKPLPGFAVEPSESADSNR